MTMFLSLQQAFRFACQVVDSVGSRVQWLGLWMWQMWAQTLTLILICKMRKRI